ncbi:MAG: hypothetical protein N3A61_01670 [Ignavibacteria bacterium]|nr:hypothetical protein [Ignavibacteria bacterium]
MMYVRLGLKLLFTSSILLFVSSCEIRKEQPKEQKDESAYKTSSSMNVIDKAKKFFGDDVLFADEIYLKDSTNKVTVVILTQTKNKIKYGIKFITADLNSDSPFVINQTEFLDGVEENSSFGNLNFADVNQKLLYYDSKTSFLGSGGGDVYVYLYDVNNGNLFSAHAIFLEGEKKILFSKELQKKNNSVYKNWLIDRIFQNIPELRDLKVREEFNLE